jgi:tetratricopeptide (TPR) repeat protein
MEVAAAAPRKVPDSVALVLLVVVMLAYWPALHGTIVWDDEQHITRTAMRGLDGLRKIWFDVHSTQQYYPLLHSAFWLEALAWGDDTVGYHLVNVLLHWGDALLVAALAMRLRIDARASWLAAFLFALHPVHVESVAWISELKNTLSLLFYLGAAIVYQDFDEDRSTRAYWIALALFSCALMTKTVTATLPAALLVLFWWKRGRIAFKRDVLPLLLWFWLAIVSGLFTAWVERTLIGAEGAEFNLDAMQRLLLAGKVICFYLWKLAWPADLIFTYPHWNVSADVVSQWLIAIVPLLLALLFFAMRSRTRTPLAALLIFGGSLFPVLGFVNVYPFRYSYVADHFQYLASIAVIVAFAACVTRLIDASNDLRVRRAIGGAAVALVCVLGVRTWQQSHDYASAETLYRATLERNPDSWKEQNNLGRLLARSEKRMPEAIPHFQAAVRLKPDHVMANYSLGVALYVTGRRAEAAAPFRRVIELSGSKPSLMLANSHLLLGAVLTDTPGAGAEAVRELETAVRMKPGDTEAMSKLAAARGRIKNATVSTQ